MLVIIEGVDGTGKSTLARALCESHGARVLHRGKPTQHPLVEYVADLAEYEPGWDEHVVCDRWHLGELVYGPLYRGGTDFTFAGFLAVEEFLIAKGAVLVHCTGRATDIRRRLICRDGDAPSAYELDKDLHAFDQVVAHSQLQRRRSYVDRPASPRLIAEFALEREQEVAGVHR